MRNVSKEPRKTAKLAGSELANLGIVVSFNRNLHRSGLCGYRPRKPPLLQKKHLQTGLEFAEDDMEIASAHRGVQPGEKHFHSETQRWEPFPAFPLSFTPVVNLDSPLKRARVYLETGTLQCW